MNALKIILYWILWPIRLLLRLFGFGGGGITITEPSDEECVTRGAGGDLTVPVVFAGAFGLGFTYVYEVHKKVGGAWVQVNGDYPIGSSLAVPKGDLGETPECVLLDIRLIRIDPASGTRTFVTSVTVNLCPKCPP